MEAGPSRHAQVVSCPHQVFPASFVDCPTPASLVFLLCKQCAEALNVYSSVLARIIFSKARRTKYMSRANHSLHNSALCKD